MLVVEDEPHIRDLIALHLSLEGLQPIAVGDGEEGLRLARAEPFDSVVLDLMLPGLDGVTVCRAIKTRHHEQRRPDPHAHSRAGRNPTRSSDSKAAPTTI